MSLRANGHRDRVVKAALRLVAAGLEDPSAHFDAELEYSMDMLDEAAAALAAALEAEG